jgi:DNA-binding transcriptional ArsR family regulator
MTTVFEMVAEPRRRRILDLVRDGERSVGELVAELSLSQPAVSKHLRVLREAGLVEARVDEQRRLYRLRPGPLRELDSWLAPYRAACLDHLADHLDGQPPSPAGARWLAVHPGYVESFGPQASAIGPPPGFEPEARQS